MKATSKPARWHGRHRVVACRQEAPTLPFRVGQHGAQTLGGRGRHPAEDDLMSCVTECVNARTSPHTHILCMITSSLSRALFALSGAYFGTMPRVFVWLVVAAAAACMILSVSMSGLRSAPHVALSSVPAVLEASAQAPLPSPATSPPPPMPPPTALPLSQSTSTHTRTRTSRSPISKHVAASAGTQASVWESMEPEDQKGEPVHVGGGCRCGSIGQAWLA